MMVEGHLPDTYPIITVRRGVIPYEDLDAQGRYPSFLKIPSDLIPTLSVLAARGPTGPKLVNCDSDGNLVTSGGGGGGGTDVSIHDSGTPGHHLAIDGNGDIGVKLFDQNGNPYTSTNPLPVTGASGGGGGGPFTPWSQMIFTPFGGSQAIGSSGLIPWSYNTVNHIYQLTGTATGAGEGFVLIAFYTAGPGALAVMSVGIPFTANAPGQVTYDFPGGLVPRSYDGTQTGIGGMVVEVWNTAANVSCQITAD